jgi:ribosomal protein S8
MTNYNFADLLVRINVAYKAKLVSVKVLKNKLTFRFLYLLYKIGLIKSFYVLPNDLQILVYLKYKKNRMPLIHSIDLISKPGKRVYWTLSFLSKNYRKHAMSTFYIISTSKGLITSNEALLYKNISGEILCKIQI